MACLDWKSFIFFIEFFLLWKMAVLWWGSGRGVLIFKVIAWIKPVLHYLNEFFNGEQAGGRKLDTQGNK